MTQTAINYGKALYELAIPREEIESTLSLFMQEIELMNYLSSPVVPQKKKDVVIEQIFQGIMARFLKRLCSYGRAELLLDIWAAGLLYYDRKQGILRAKVRCNSPLSEKEKNQIRRLLAKDMNAHEILMEEILDEKLLGGYLVEADGVEYDFSYEGHVRQLEKKLTGRCML